jgi:hypothetical protein
MGNFRLGNLKTFLQVIYLVVREGIESVKFALGVYFVDCCKPTALTCLVCFPLEL